MKPKKMSEDNPPQQKRTIEKKKIIGPVKDLEEYVLKDWWRKIFNFLYLKTDGDIVDDQKITKEEIDLILKILKPKPEDKILDLCCGQGRHSLELARRGFLNLEGLDRSNYLIYRAKSSTKKERLSIRFREGDARKLPYQPDTFDIVLILGNSFGYFDTIQDDLRALKEIFRVLKPWGKLLIDIADGDYLKNHFEPRSWEWIGKKHFVCRERSLSGDTTRLITREIITDIEKGVIQDQFYAERLYDKEKIVQALEEANFSDTSFVDGILSTSERNQDLGMMKRRFFVTARIKKEWTPIKKKLKEDLKNIVVLLGDPKLSDSLKPNFYFDDDDFYTIDQLKQALKELSGYQFIYLNNHNTLIQDLSKLIGKITLIFNLCDEGYLNDPRKELLIPSLLEILNLPYTGSGPQSLAFCYDKSLVRGVAKEMKIPVPEAFFIKPGDSVFETSFDFPIIVKPNFGDSSFGITQKSVVNNFDDLTSSISEIRKKFGYDKPILIEKFLSGKDLSVGILGNPQQDYTILPIIEEDYSSLSPELPKICGYEAKWLPDSPYWNIVSRKAELSKEIKNFIIESCLKLFERLECRDYVRFDWRLDENGNPSLLEVNPNPGWCWDGHLNKMANIAGIPYPKLLQKILNIACIRLGI